MPAASDPSPGDTAFTEHELEVDGRAMRYSEAGVGDPLIALHGGLGHAANLAPALGRLAGNYRVLAPELPGFGRTSGAGITSLRDLGRVVTAFAAALDIRSTRLLGTSVGAAVALWAAIDTPTLVSTMVLEAPAAFREGVPPPPQGGDGPPPPDRAFLQSVIGPATDPDLVAALPGCEVPTLVMFGTDDPMFPPRFGPQYRRLPASSIAIVYAAGHDIKGERPDAFVATVADYLERGPAFVVSTRSTLIHA